MEIECDLASIRDEDLLRKMWQQSEDFGRKKEIRSHLYKLRESRLREFYSTGGAGGDIMNPATDLCFGKSPLTPSHGDSLVDQSFQSLKSKEVRDSESPTREIKFRNSGGVAGGVLVPDTTGWNVQTSSEVSPDGRAFRTETLAKTDGVEKIPGGRAEFAGRNEQKSSASHQGDDKNFVKKAAESSKTHLQEKIVVGDENSGRTEMKSSSVTSSSSKVVSSSSTSQVISSGDPGFDSEPRRLTQDQQYQKVLSAANTSALRSEQQQQYQRNERSERNERNETSSNVREESKKYVDMDKASPEYQQHVQYLMSQPGAIVSNTVEYPKPGVKMITTVKQLPDGTTVKTKRYETEASADTGSISQTMKQQQQQRVSSSTTQKTTEKRIQDSEDVFTRLARTRDNTGPVSPRKTPETPSQDDIYARLQKSRGEQKFSDTIDQRSTQILRDTNQYPNTVVPHRAVDNVELISTNKTVKKDLNQTVRNEKITSADFIQTERDRYVIDRDSPSRRGPDGLPETLAPITPGRYRSPQPDDIIPTNGLTSTGVIQQSSKSSAKFSESRRFSTETVESYQHSESHNESQDFTTHGFPSVRRPIEEPKGRSPSGRPGQDFSTHGFPSVRSDKPTQEYPSGKPSTHEEYNTTERVHIVSTDAYPDSTTSTTRRHVTSTTDDFSTHGFPSVRPGTPTRDPSRRPLGSEPAPGDSPRRPSGQEPPANHIRKPPSDGFSTHGFPSVKTGSPTGDSPRRPSGPEPTIQGRRPTTEDFSSHGFPSVKPGRSTPTQSAPQYDDLQRTPTRRLPSVDRDDNISVTSDRSNSITYEKRIDAAHQAFARSLRCASPVESIRRDSISDRQTPKASVSTIRNSYSPSKRDGRSPSHESITNSESSRISSGTVTRSSQTRPTTTDIRRVSGPKSPIGKSAPSHVSNETIDITLTRKITAKPTDSKPAGRPSTVKDKSNSAEPILRKKIFAATEDFLASEGVAEEPILKKEHYYQLGPSDATLPSSRLKTRRVLGTTPNTSRRATTYNTEEDVNTTNHTTTTLSTPTRSTKTQQDTKPDTLYSSKPKTKPEGYISLNRANEITEKHNQTTNKQVSYPHYIPSAPKADRSSPHPERPQTTSSSPSDRPTKNLSSPAPTTTSTTTPHNAPQSATDKPKVAPSTSPTTKPSSYPSKVDNSTTRFTKTVKVDNAITRDTTKTRREPEREPQPLPQPEDIDEGYVPDRKGQRKPTSKRPTSDDEGFEPESPRAGSPTSDFEYRRPTQPETYDEEDSIFKRTRKTDKKTVTNDFLDTERGVKQSRRPQDEDRKPSYLIDEPRRSTDHAVKEPRRPGDLEPKRSDEPKGPTDRGLKGPRRPEDYLTDEKRYLEEPNGPSGPKQTKPRRPEEGQPRAPTDRSLKEPIRPEDRTSKPSYLTDEEPNGPSGPRKYEPRRPEDNEPRGPTDRGVKGPIRPEDEPKVPSDSAKPRGSKPPLDRSETFEERCRHILGMENETTIERENIIQDFIDSERVTVDAKRKPAGRSPSPQKKEPSDTVSIVSIEDCDDDDDGVSRKYPSERTTTTTRTTKTTNGEYPRDKSPSKKPVGRGDQPRDKYPVDKTPRSTRESEIDETTVRTTTKSTRPRDESPLGKSPRGTRPTEIDETTARKTTTRDTTIVDEIDDRSPSTRPIDGSPLGKTPRGTSPINEATYDVGRPRDKSPSKKPTRGSSPTDETITSKTTTTTRDTTVTDDIDDRYPSSRPRGYPIDHVQTTRTPKDITTKETTDDVFEPSRSRDRPQGFSPTDDIILQRTTTTTRDTTISGSPTSRPRDYPRDLSPTEKPRGHSPIDEITVKKATTTTRDTTTVGETERSPLSRPRDYLRDRSPTEKLRGRSPTDDTTVKRTTTGTRDTTITDEIDDRSPSPRPRDYPRDRSPTEKPHRRSPTDDLTVKRTTTTSRDTTTIGEIDDRSPSSRPRDYPRGQFPTEKPRGRSPTDDTTVKRTTTETRDTTITDVIDDRSPSPRPRDYPRDRSPTEKPHRRSPTDDLTVKRTTTTTRDTTTVGEIDDRSPSSRPRDYPRGRSPTEKPRSRSPTNDTTVKKTTTTTRDTTIIGEINDRSPSSGPSDYPRGRSPTEKPRDRSPTDTATVKRTTIRTKDTTISDDRSPSPSPRDYPRDRSPTEKSHRRSPTDDITAKRTTTTSRDTTTIGEIDDRSPSSRPRDYPRNRSPTDKPRGLSPTDDTTVKRTTTTTRDTTIIGDINDRSPSSSPRNYPRDRSPTEKPRGHSPIDTTTVKRTTTRTRDTTNTDEIDDRSPRDRSPIEKPHGPSPTDDITVKRTTTTSRDTTTIGEIDDRSPSSRRRDYPRDRSPTEKPHRRSPTDDLTVKRTTTTSRDTTIIGEIDDRAPSSRPRDYPRGRSPTEKPRGHSPTDDKTVKRTTTTSRDTTIVDEIDDRSPSSHPRDRSPSEKPTRSPKLAYVDETTTEAIRKSKPRDRSPNEKPIRSPRIITTTTTTEFGIEDRPRSQSPSDKPRRPRPVESEEIDETYVGKTTKTTKGTTIVSEFDVDDHSPKEKPIRRPRPSEETDTEDHPRGKSPEKPKGTRPSEPCGTTDDDRTSPRDRSPSEKPKRPLRPSDRSPSPRSKASNKYPRGPKPIDEETRPRDRSPTGKQPKLAPTSSPRRLSPSEKPRRSPPTGEEIEETVVQRTTKTTRDTNLEEIDFKKRPRNKSPSEKLKYRPRETSPTEKPRKRRPSEDETDETLVETTIEITTTEGDSPKDRPRGTSPSEKLKRRQPTDEEIEETVVQRTTKSTRDRTTLEEIRDRSPKDRPREKSPLEKFSPRGISPTEKSSGPRPTDETVIQRTVRVTTDRTTVDDRSPKDRPRGTSPTEKPRRHQPTDEKIDVTVVQKTAKTTSDRTTLEEVSNRSPRDRYPEDRPRDRSPCEKPRGSKPTDTTVVQRTTVKTTTIEDRSSKSPRGISPSEKPGPKGYPRDKSPTEKPRGVRPTSEANVERTVKTTTDRTTVDRSPKDHPRGTSPSEKPTRRQPTDIEETVVKRTSKITKDRTTLEETDVEDRSQKDRPREISPSEKPKRRRPSEEDESDETDETIVQTTIETTTIEGDSPKDRPRGTSPSQPRRRLPTDEDIEQTVVQETTKTTRDRTTMKETDIKDQSHRYHPREKSPSEKPSTRDRSPTEKPRGPRPTGETILLTTVKTTTIEGDRIRGISPSEKPRRRQPSDEEIIVQRTSEIAKDRRTLAETDIEGWYPEDRLRDRSPSEKPRGPRPNEETVVQITTKTTDRTTVQDRPRGTSPSEKPRRRQPTDEDIEVNVVQRTSKTTKNRTTLEEIEGRSPKDRPRGQSPSEKPYSRPYPRDTSPSEKLQRPTKTTRDETFEDRYPEDRPRDRSPSEKPKGPRSTDETVLHRTVTTRTVEDRPRGTSPSEKPRSYIPSDEETDETCVRTTTKTSRDRTTLKDVKDRPRGTSPSDRSPSDKSRRPRPSEIDETTVRSTTTRKILQETDFEKRYPKGRPTDQSPVDKSSTRRPSKPTTVTTTTTRNRSTLEEQDLTRSPRPKTQPSTRDKVPTKTTPSYPRSQPTAEKRIPAELPSPGRKPKSTFGTTTKTTTQTSVTRTPVTRPKVTKDLPTKIIKLVAGPIEPRPGARQPERKHSPSISPDSSPSRPTSEVDLESPHRSPNTSPSRTSPSPTRSVKLEDITSSVVTTKKTTVSIDKSKPKVTHITTAKFQVSPPTSPTKVINAPEIKSSPSKKPVTKVSTPKPIGSRLTTDKTTAKKVTTVRKDVVIPTDSERDSEVPTDLEDVDSPLSHKTPTRKLPVTERKESAPVHRVTQVDKDVQKMSRSTSENTIKTSITKRPLKHEPLEPITQREATKPTGGKTSPKTERRPSKHLSTKTINLTTFEKVINSQDMENVVIDIQQAKSSREPSPNKIVPTPVSVDLYTGKPRYPDVVQEPEDEPRRKPNVKNIPIFEEETNDFVGCQITEVNEESFEGTTKVRTRKFIDGESRPQLTTPTIITGDNVDNECLLSVHDKVSKFISTAEEVSKPKTSAPFRRDVPELDVPEDDECLLTVDEKVNKFLKTAESVTREAITSTPKPIERPRIDDLDEDLRTDECVLSVSEKVNKFTTKAEKLAPSAPQRSPELVARVERQISRQSDVEPESPRDTREYPESPEDEDSTTTVRKVKQTKSLFERDEKKYIDRQIDILSRPSVWDKKPRVSDVKLDDILGYSPEDEPEPVNGAPRRKSPVKDQPDVAFSKPTKPVTDTVSKKKEIFENKISTQKTTATSKPSSKSPERAPRGPIQSPSRKQPSDESDSRYQNEFKSRYVDGYPQESDDVHEDVYGSLKTRRSHETSSLEKTTLRQSSERSPTRKSSHPEIRPTTQTPTRTQKQPYDHSRSPRRHSDDHSPQQHPTRDQPQTDSYMETRETSEYTTRRRSPTQKYPEDHTSDCRTPHDNSPSPSRKQPVDEPEDYIFSSRREETNKHHTTRTSYRSPKDTPLNPNSILDDEEHDHSPARSTSTISSQKRTTTHRTTSNRLTEDTTSRRPRRPSGNEPSTPRGSRPKGVPETVAARRNIFEASPGDLSPRTGHRRPSYMDHTKSSLEHTRRDSLEITKTNYSRKSSVEDEPYEASPRSAVKFGVGLKHKEEPKPRRKLSSSDIPNIEDVFELDLLEEMLNIVTLYEQRRRIRAQIRVVKKLLETKTKEEVSKMTKITTYRKTSSSSVRDSPIPRRDTPMRPDRYQPSDDIDSESIIESRHIEEREEIIRERSISPQTKSSKTVTKVTEVRKIGEPATPKRMVPRKEEPKDSKPIWATKNILKKPSENEKVARALSAKKTTSTSSSSTSRTQQTHRQRVAVDEDCITSSYGIGPTDEDGRPLFGIRALKKKTTTSSKPSETTKVTGTVITEKYYSENGAEPVGERKVMVYSTNPEDLLAMETQYDRRDSETVKRERLSKDGLTTVTKVQKIGQYKPGEVPAITDDAEFTQTTPKTVRRGSVKEMSEKFIRKESSSSVTEKSSGYPKAGLILRTRTNSGATADAADQYEVRAKSAEYDDESENECDVQIRTSRKHSKVVTESEDETEIRRKMNTRSFLNSAGSKVTGVDDVLDRMRNADNVVVDGDTLEDREARALLNKFLGASVLMTGMESIIPQKELKKATTGADKSKKQEVKTTRVTKTTKTAAAGGSSSSPVARETCDFEEIWDEEILKELLEKSTSYEERRSIRARLRQLMAEREACAELVASVKAELDNDTKAKTTSSGDKKVVEEQQLDDDSSCSEYEEIIEEYTASEDEEDEKTTTVIPADKKKEEVKDDESKTNKITKEIQKTTTITKKEEPKQIETKKTVVVEKTTVIKKDATPSSVDGKKQTDTKVDDDEASVSADNSKGESLLIPLLQGLLHKNMPQARSSSSTSKTATTTTTTKANQNSNNLKSSLKSNNTHFSSTSSNNNNSLGDSGLSSEVSKNSSLGTQQGGSTLRVTAQQIEDSGTESGEDLRLIAAGIRDSMQIEGIEDQSDMSLIKEVTNALNRLESSLKEGKDLALDNSKKSTLLALVERLQTGLTAPDKLSSAVGEQDFPDETSSPEADNHRSNRQRFAKRRNRNNRHTVGVSKEELADARRYMEEMVMIGNLSNCTTPEGNVATTPPQFAIQKQYSTGTILSNHDPQQVSSSLFRPNQFVPSNLKHSTEAGSTHPDVQLRQKKGNPGSGQRQSAGDMDHMTVANPDSSAGKRPLSDSYDSYSAQNNRVTFSDTKKQDDISVQEKNHYNRSYRTDNQPDVTNRMSPDSARFNRFNNKKQLMKRANTIDIPKSHHYNPEFDTDSEFEDKSTFNVKGLRGTVQVSVKRKPRQVVPNFEPKTENDHKFLAFIQKQNTTPGLGWNSSKSVSNWTNKFGNIKNVFESGAAASNSNRLKVSASPASSAKNFWKKADEQTPPKVSTSVLTSALKAKERNEQLAEVVVPKPIHMNKFIHNPQSAFRPIDTSPETIHMQFKPIPMEKPANIVNNFSPTKAYNPVSYRKQPLESPHYAQSSPTKSWVKKNTATNSPVTLPWTVKPPENSVLKMAATKFESKSPLSAVQRHQSFKQQEKRPSLPNATQPYQYQYDGYSQPSYMSNSQPASYADYTQPRVARENSLTNPRAEPLVLTPDKPAYSPHSLQPFDYYTGGLCPNVPQTDMTDDDIDDMESMTEYRVEAKVMGKPMSQQAVTVGKRTAHVSDDEVFGKNSRAAKSLLSVMKNIGNGGVQKASKKIERSIAPSACMSPDGRAYQAPLVEPLFPEVAKFEPNRLPEYIGPQPFQQQQRQQVVEYQNNSAYVPLVDFEHQQPPVAPPRGRKVSQEKNRSSPYFPQERPNVYQQPRREAPSSLPLQTRPISPPSYNSPSKTPEVNPYTAQIITDGMYMQNIPTFRQPYSGPNTPDDYTAYQPQAHSIHSQHNPKPKSYAGQQPVVNLPQIPLETSFTKVYDQPRDIAPYYQPPATYRISPSYESVPSQPIYAPVEIQKLQAQKSPIIQQSPQPSAFEVPPQYYQPKSDIPPQYIQSPKVQHSPQLQAYAQQQTYQQKTEGPTPYYQSPKMQQSSQQNEVPPQYYQSPKVQQSQQPPAFAPQQAYQPKIESPASYYQSPKVQQSSQQPVFTPQQTEVPPQYYQSPKIQQGSQPPVFAPQQYQSPKIQQIAQPSAFTSPQAYQSKPEISTQSYQSPKVQQPSKPPSFVPKTEAPSQYSQSPKIQQSPQPLSVPYQPMAQQTSKQAPQHKPQVPPKSESLIQSSKSQYTSSTHREQQSQNTVIPDNPIKQPLSSNTAVLCKQASLDGRKRVQSQSQLYEKVEEVRRKSLGNVLEITRLEREAREQKAAAIKQDMYSVQQDVYSQQVKTAEKTEIRQQQTKVYKSSAPDDTPDIVKSSLAKDDIPILKKFGPPQRHCYIPNAYQNPLTKSETTVAPNPKPAPRKFSEPSVSRGPIIVEIPSTPQPDGQDEIPRNIVFNNVNAFTSMSRRYGESSTEYTSQQNRPNKLSKCDSWHQICQLQNAPKPPSPKFNNTGNALRRSKSGHTLALPKLYEAGYDKIQITEKQKTVAAYFSGQKSPNSLSRNSSHTNLTEESSTVKKSSINRIKTSQKASISRQNPSSGLSRSHTMPQIANINLLDESNVEDAFEQLMNELSTTTTEKTETKEEDGGVVTTTTKVTTRTITGAPKPVSPFAKFQQLDKQNSLQSPKSPLTPTTPGGSSSAPIFRFTDPALNARAATVKDQLLQWCQSKTQEYENVQITNFSASWTDGLAFCALIHHFLPDAFDYSKLSPKQRRYNFELAFRVADEKAGIAPLLDVEDMVVMRRPDWKCVFTYVQSIYRRFRNCQ